MNSQTASSFPGLIRVDTRVGEKVQFRRRDDVGMLTLVSNLFS
jgi:hypothetical protein